jgi:phosphatidylserine/phosphatidylglycerophosphate/cardiolipin synthase-like enzyme
VEQKYIQEWLVGTLDDFKLSQSEALELRELLPKLMADDIAFIRNKSFLLAREQIISDGDTSVAVLLWLEKIVKTIDNHRHAQTAIVNSAHFSPGDDCRRKLLDLCVSARQSIDVSVFTIADDRLVDAILAAHQRGIDVRIITDNDKARDEGSDIFYMMDRGIEVRMDNAVSHMHHKFAIIDRRTLVNGSFNWTRSASDYNQENILVTDESKLVSAYIKEFEDLWCKFSAH